MTIWHFAGERLCPHQIKLKTQCTAYFSYRLSRSLSLFCCLLLLLNLNSLDNRTSVSLPFPFPKSSPPVTTIDLWACVRTLSQLVKVKINCTALLINSRTRRVSKWIGGSGRATSSQMLELVIQQQQLFSFVQWKNSEWHVIANLCPASCLGQEGYCLRTFLNFLDPSQRYF